MLKSKKVHSWRFEALSFIIIFSLIGTAWFSLQWIGGRSDTIQRSNLNTTVQAQAEVAAERDEIIPSFRELVEPTLSGLDDSVSVVVTDLNSREQVSHNPDTIHTAASLYKLFAAEEALRLVDINALSLAQPFDDSRGLDLAACLDIVITISDNGCGVILQRETNALYSIPSSFADNGYINTDLRGVYPETTASDVDRLFQNVYDKASLSQESSDLFLANLKNQTIRNRIPAQLPEDIVIAHKTADLEGSIHDAGIIFTNGNPYVLTIMTSPQDGTYEDRYQMIAQLSREIYEALN